MKISSYVSTEKSVPVATIFGNEVITEPVLVALLQSPSMQRLKKINQYGVSAYLKNNESFNRSRYDHSVGVMLLLRRYGAPLSEQIAGLLHDVSHTIFSHVGDYIFNTEHKKDSYQDSIHEWFLCNTELADILKQYNYQVDSIIHKNGTFPMLEQELPNICTDRLEYNLHDAYLCEQLTLEDIATILNSIDFADTMWFFSDIKAAKKLGEVSLFLTEHVFGAPWNILTYEWAARAVQRAVEIGLISKKEVHFGTDDVVWLKLCRSKDQVISQLITSIKDHEKLFMVSDAHSFDKCLKTKFRGIDPLVKIKGGYSPLTEIDQSYAINFKLVRKKATEGRYITFIENK